MVMGELPVETEVLVIGGGPGGYTAAFRAAGLGFDVTLVTDEPELGGVCLLRGCIPSKTLLSLAELIAMSRAAAPMGLHFEEPKVEIDEMRAWKNHVVKQLADGLGQLCDQRGVNRVQARATFREADTVHLENGETHSMTFKHAIVATGSRPIALPDTPFSDRIMDSSGALELADIPHRLLVVGGGYVGLELGLVYAALGSQVTLVEMTDRLLPSVDVDLVQPLARRLQDRFEGMHFNTKVTALKPDKHKVRATFAGDANLDMDAESQHILGVGMVGAHAEALIAEGALAIEMGALAQDVALTVHPHPTLSETIGEAAQSLLDSATHVLAQKK